MFCSGQVAKAGVEWHGMPYVEHCCKFETVLSGRPQLIAVCANNHVEVVACVQDVVYAAANLKAMSFIGGGAQNFQEFFEFLGTVKDKRVPPAGSPFQIDFPGESKTPKGMVAANETVPPCWDSALRCSCGDCPEGPQCSPVRFAQLCHAF